ncbi:cytochrome b [Methylobacterium sp. E-065]|uniref:cytochrome b n=1 Tax=Methylobacterium sp. E-065 TaxID=2836583 RepID=UPI001FB9AA10|nr:cytochrome b [Methylobacterium sp. E-065]MCJ2019547.1 cytochrome b [Methylobacterium sp. E-065]
MAGWLDTPHRYGRISRAFHWLMAALFAWQFAGALLYVGIGDTTITRFLDRSHYSLGFALFILALLRGAWGLANLGRRPPHPGRLGRAVVAGHALIYALMVAVPGIALLRQYGSGRSFSPFGIPVMPGHVGRISWMMAPANLVHDWLGFILLAVVLVHAATAFVHRVQKKDALTRIT